MTVVEAKVWAVHPQLAFGYRTAGLAPGEARAWADFQVWPEVAAIWVAAGFDLAVVALGEACRTVPYRMDDPEIALLWGLTNVHPQEAIEHASAGLSPVAFLADVTSAPVEFWSATDGIYAAAGYSADDTEALRSMYYDSPFTDPAVAIVWALTGLDPRVAIERAAGGTCPVAFLTDLIASGWCALPEILPIDNS